MFQLRDGIVVMLMSHVWQITQILNKCKGLVAQPPHPHGKYMPQLADVKYWLLSAQESVKVATKGGDSRKPAPTLKADASTDCERWWPRVFSRRINPAADPDGVARL